MYEFLHNGKLTTHIIKQSAQSSHSDFWSAYKNKLLKLGKEINKCEMLIRWRRRIKGEAIRHRNKTRINKYFRWELKITDNKKDKSNSNELTIYKYIVPKLL